MQNGGLWDRVVCMPTRWWLYLEKRADEVVDTGGVSLSVGVDLKKA